MSQSSSFLFFPFFASLCVVVLKLFAAWMRILLTFLISDVCWVLANITSESSHCFQKGNRNSGCRLFIMVCPSFWEDYYMLIYTHCWDLMNSVGSHGSLSLPFVMKVMVCHFVSNSHEVMTPLIVVLPIIVVVEISLQLHQALLLFVYAVLILGICLTSGYRHMSLFFCFRLWVCSFPMTSDNIVVC